MNSSERLITFADKSLDPALPSQPSYQLLALPPALLQLLTSSASSDSSDDPAAAPAAPLEIRGDPSDLAVLVSPTQTYALRGVQNSNSLCVCSSGGGGGGRGQWFVAGGEGVGGSLDMDVDGDNSEPARKKQRREREQQIEIEAVLHETLEAVPGVARTEKVEGLLRGCEYEGEAVEEELVAAGKNPRQKHTFDSLRARLPASDAEIRTALSRKRIVTLSTFLRPLAPAFLLAILPSVLKALPLPAEIAHPAAAPAKGKKGAAAPAAAASSSASAPLWAEATDADLLDALDAVDCGNDEVAGEVLGWFGERVEGGYRKMWKVDARKVVREVGVWLLEDGGFGQQAADPFVAKWKSLCGGFSPVCDHSLLAGLLLHRPPPLNTLQYLPPSSLSPDASTRFSELFALKPRWLEADMSLFIDDLTGGDKKKRDALVLKFVRKVKEGSTTWWTARNLWS
ncbi:hypothetical protein JCM6882_001730 [Rhodosporidiobolus microsporus]